MEVHHPVESSPLLGDEAIRAHLSLVSMCGLMPQAVTVTDAAWLAWVRGGGGFGCACMLCGLIPTHLIALAWYMVRAVVGVCLRYGLGRLPSWNAGVRVTCSCCHHTCDLSWAVLKMHAHFKEGLMLGFVKGVGPGTLCA